MNKQLLVVDDEAALCRMLSTFFAEKGFHVVTAGTAHDALAQIHRMQPDVVLLDLNLPDSSGLELLSTLKSKFPSLRVVIISGLCDEQTIQQAFRLGANDYLEKPFEFTQCFYAAMGLETVDVTTAQVHSEALARVPVSVAKRYQVLPLRWDEATLELAMADPLDVQRLDELKTVLDCIIKPLGVVAGDLETAIQRSYGVGAGISSSTAWPKTSEPGRAATPSPEWGTEDSAGVSGLMHELIQRAYDNRATDLHLGISPQGPWIRERIDGILYDVPVSSQFGDLYASVISRIKVMANLDIAEHRLPQDGRIWFESPSTKLDLRVSVLPTVQGESVTIRLLEPSWIFQAEKLGLSEEQHQQLVSFLAKPTGLLLVTGPTGSGKSSTLYAFLTRLNTGRVNIVTLEDPVEHELPGATQTQVQPKVGLTFASGLRSMLRHDPDIVMVGEIRDQETAGLAVRASLTGHLVLSTLHTNDAASGITRLLDLGIEPFLLCSTVSGIVSQRLVRRLCESCRESSDVAAASLVTMGVAVPRQRGTVRVWRAKGCRACNKTGYYGRTGIFELLVIDHHIRSLVIKRTSSTQIRQSALARGMMSLAQSGWQKAEAGITSFEELIRVLPSEERG